jgi:HEAT repeat protein
MSRISVPHDSSFSAAEVRRQRKAEEAFERRCAEAAKEIERITDPDVLVARLRDHALDGAVMIAIERALASMSDATVARAEGYLAQESYDVALSVTSALIKIGRPAVDTLLRIVRSSGEEEARRWACRALGAIGDERAVPVLVNALTDGAPNVRAAAAEAFERLPHDRAIDRLRTLLRDVEIVRSAAARTLHRRWVPSVDLEEEVLRALAADSLSAAGAAVRLPAGAKSLLVRIARSGDLVARERSLRALGHRGEDDEVLMEATVSSHGELRRAAMTALAQIHATQSGDALARLSDEEWRRLRRLDDASQPSELFPTVAGTLRTGDVVRLADEAAERWCGRWSEAIVIGEELVGVRGDGNDFDAISVADLLARGRRHPDPRRWKAEAAAWRREIASRRY